MTQASWAKTWGNSWGSSWGHRVKRPSGGGGKYLKIKQHQPMLWQQEVPFDDRAAKKLKAKREEILFLLP